MSEEAATIGRPDGQGAKPVILAHDAGGAGTAGMTARRYQTQ